MKEASGRAPYGSAELLSQTCDDNSLRTALAYGVVLSVQFVFTGYQILAKVALAGKGINPVSFALVRAIGTTIALSILGCVFQDRSRITSKTATATYPLNFNTKHASQFVVLGFCMAGNVLGLIFALNFTSSAMVAILQVLRPVFAGLISRFIGAERFSPQMLFGVALCIVGTSMITTHGTASAREGESTSLGVLFVCIHSFGQAMYVIQQPALLDEGYSPFVVNSGAFLVASSIIGLCFCIPHPLMRNGILWDSSFFFLSLLAYSIFLVGVYCYCAMGWAAKIVGGTAVMLFMLVQAILTTAAGRLFLDEQMNATEGLGGVLILVGIIVYARGKAVMPSHAKEPDV